MLMGNEIIKIFFNFIFQYRVEEILPVPLQLGQTSWVLIFISGFIRCRVICIKPNLEIGSTACLARSGPHEFFHFLHQFLFIFWKLHINKVHDDNSTNIS